MRKILRGKAVFLMLLAFLLVIGCGGSKQMTTDGDNTTGNSAGQDDYDEIEKLLGISGDGEKKQANKENGDDLLQLLEADEGQKTKLTPQEEVEAEKQKLQTVNKQKEEASADVKAKLREKDMQIADLKAQLMMAKEELNKSKKPSSSSSLFASEKSGYNYSANASNPDDYIREYQSGMDAFHNREYKSAISIFEGLLQQSTSHCYADNAQYWIGESYFAMGQYREAIVAFEKVFTFKFSNKNDYAQFKIGQCYFKLGDKQKARNEFQTLLDNYKRPELLDRAKDYLAQM